MRNITKKQNKSIRNFFAVVALFLVATVSFGACSNNLIDSTTTDVKMNGAFSVSVIFDTSDFPTNRSLAFDNGSVTNVTILVYDALGERIGSGSLAKGTTKPQGHPFLK